MDHLKQTTHWIGGDWPCRSERRERVNPATVEVIGQFFNGSAHTARAAVDATAVAFEDDLRSNEEGDFKTCGSGGLGGLVYVEDCHEYKQITQDFVSHAD